MVDRLGTIPNAFYDLIVFVTPSVVFAFGLLIGLDGVGWTHSLKLSELGAVNLIGLLIAGLVASYEFGRIAEAWSAVLVQRPLSFLVKHTRLFQSPDFLSKYIDVYATLGISGTSDGRDGDKWVIYLYGFIASPGLGEDLLKRYAWEKLARSSAFSYLILFLISVSYGLGHLFAKVPLPARSLGFGGVLYTVVTTILIVLTYVEYYKRNAWNHDLLIKTTPVLLEAMRVQQLSATVAPNSAPAVPAPRKRSRRTSGTTK